MKRYNTYIATLTLALISTFCTSLSAQTINPITQAALDAYDQLLAKDPTDAITLYQRAAQLYQINQYDRALADVTKALAVVPVKNKQLIHDLNILGANTCVELNRYDEALQYANAALAVIPGDIPALYLCGNINLHLNQPAAAEQAFQALQRKQPRSQEAILGLAHVAALRGDFTTAAAHLEQVKKLAPSDPLTYCRIGDMATLMQNYPMAASNYLNAFSLSTASNRERAMSSLISLSDNHWKDVDDTIDYAISQTQNTTPLIFLKASIAFKNAKYPEAYTAYRQLIDAMPEADPSILFNAAASALRMGLTDEAATLTDRALALKNNSVAGNILRSQIYLAKNKYAQAVDYAQRAQTASPFDRDALMQLAKAQIASRQYDAALQTLNTTILQNPAAIDALMLRGYIVSNGLTAQPSGISDYQRVSTLTPVAPLETVLKAVAQNLSGKTLDAQTSIQSILESADDNPENAYIVALYYANTGNSDLARQYLKKATDNGYSDKYTLSLDPTPMLTTSSIR